MREVRCTFSNWAYLRIRLSLRSISRSAAPLASVGIMGLGLVPTLGGPDSPLHWAMTAGMTGFGLLLALRHRLRRDQPPLALPTEAEARQAGGALLWVSGVIAAMVVAIVLNQLISGGPTSAFSVGLPLVGLWWVASLGFKARRFRSPQVDDSGTTADRPSRRPPTWERLTPPDGRPPGGPGRHASA